MMKPHRLLGAALALILFAGAEAAAQDAKYSWAAGLELHHQRYEEDSLNVEEKGYFGGLTLEGQADFRTWLARIDGRLAYGQMDYTGSGSIDSIDNWVFEARIIAGPNLAIAPDARVTPYIGYGYRTLIDLGGGRLTSTGFAGYDRWSQYHYIPVGVEGEFRLSPAWSVKPTLEYDYFITGTQNSYLSNVAGYSDAENDQDSGYGLRASLMFGTTAWQRPVEFGPFVRYWHIDQSDYAPFVRNGTQIGLVYEPENETIEAGLAVKMRF
jgi:hypothetical protein